MRAPPFNFAAAAPAPHAASPARRAARPVSPADAAGPDLQTARGGAAGPVASGHAHARPFLEKEKK